MSLQRGSVLGVMKSKFKFDEILFVFLMGAVIFSISYTLVSSYTLGDQAHYRLLYAILAESAAWEVLDVARRTVSGAEPVSAYVLWIGSKLGISKDIYISLFNTALIMLLALFLRRNSVPWSVVLLVMSNYYVIVLMTGAERLKFAYIILLCATLFRGRLSKFVACLSPFAHLQSIILLAAVFISSLANGLKEVFRHGRLRYRVFWGVLGVTIVVSLIYLFLGEAIIAKGVGYAQRESSILETLQLGLLSIVAMYATRRRLAMAMMLLPFFPTVLALGGMRVNMIAVSAVIYVLTIERRLVVVPVLFVLIYLSWKSIPFVNNIFEYGNGYHGI